MSGRIAAFLMSLMLCATPALAGVREARVPLHEGKLRAGDLSAALCDELGLPKYSLHCREINLRGLGGSVFVAALNESLGDGCNISVADDALVIRLDTAKLPDDCREMKQATRVFTKVAAPEATARQSAYYGLWTPKQIDTTRPLVVVVHGLDCDRLNWQPMIELLKQEGRQVAVFTYPSDQAIADSAAELGARLADLRMRTSNLSYDLICHSMGGLVARAYVESSDYRGGVERLIMLGTPNIGSKLALYRFALEVDEHWDLWRQDPDWSPSWMITDGLGEAGSDLRPRSKFLKTLNSRPRRAGVKYTIIAGNQHPARRVTANSIEATADSVPAGISKWWGVRQTKRKLESVADRMRLRGDSDGPVSVDSCRLKGVDDFVVVAADHASLCYPRGKRPPAAWETIRDRLRR